MKLRVIVVYLLSYVFLDWVSYVHPVLPIGITPWNPPPGLSLFLLLVFGLRYWPWLFVAALSADIIVRGAPAPLAGVGGIGCFIDRVLYTGRILFKEIFSRIHRVFESAQSGYFFSCNYLDYSAGGNRLRFTLHGSWPCAG